MAVVTRPLSFSEKTKAVSETAQWMIEQYECDLGEATQIAQVAAEKLNYRPIATNGSTQAISSFVFKLQQYIDQEYAS